MNAFTSEGLRELLTLGLSYGGKTDLGHPALVQAKADGYVVSDYHDAGGVCEVWLGSDSSMGRKVAIKCVKQGELHADAAELLLHHEANVLSALRGEAGITPLGAGGEGESAYLVLPWVDGERIDRAIAANPSQAEHVIRRALERLAAIHDAGFAHGDLKPAHLMVSGGDVVLLDFGLARHLASSGRASLTPKIAGVTPEFAPPGVTRGEDATPAHDAYSMGVVLKQLGEGLPKPTASAVRRVVSLHDAKDGRTLLACFETALRRRRRTVQAAALATTLATIAVGGVGSGVTIVSEWPGLLGMRAASPQAVARSEAAPLPPWSAGLAELDRDPQRVTVLHELNEMSVRATARSTNGEIAWMLHTGDVELWSPIQGTRLIALPQAAGRPFSARWNEAGELLAVTRDGRLWNLSADTPSLVVRLDPETARFQISERGVEGWSRQSRRIVRAVSDGVRVVTPPVVAAIPCQGPTPDWVVLDESTRVLGSFLHPAWAIELRDGEDITAAYCNEAGDLAVGLSNGDILHVRGGERPVRYHALDDHVVTAICVSPDGETVFVGSHKVVAFDLGRQEVVASRGPAGGGLVLALSIDAGSGKLIVSTSRSAESWQLADPATTLASH